MQKLLTSGQRMAQFVSKLLIVSWWALIVFVPVPGRAQDLATIAGTVTDVSGARISGVVVSVANPEHGFVRTVVSDAAGEYAAPRIPIGAYTVTTEKAGFKKIVQNNINLTVGETLRIDLQLQVGSANQEITVSAVAARVETETGTISDVVTESQISQLNLNNRNFTNLAILTPGAATLPGGYDPTQISPLAPVAISFNGLPGQFNNWEMDGMNNVDQGDGSNSLMAFPSLDSLQEFRVSTSIYNAEYGKAGAASIEVATKSGTKKFHGDLFEFVRNDALDANNWFLNRTITAAGQKAPKQPLKRNDFGFTLGGPLFIPGHYNTAKNKTFFFVSEEWRKNREGTVIDAPVPTLRMRTGDFSECDHASANFNPVVASGCVLPNNPVTGQLFPGNVVPIDPTSKTLLDSLVPKPNNGVLRYTTAPSLATEFREDMFRFDHNLTDNTRVFVRYTQEAYDQEFLPTLWSGSNFATVKTKFRSPVKLGVVHLTEVFRPNLLNEVILGYSNDVNEVQNTLGFDSPAGSISRPSGFGVKTIFPANAQQPFLPGINVSGGVPFSFGESTGFRFFFYDPQPEIKDNLVWQSGHHTIKIGFQLQYNHINTTTNIGQSSAGLLSFSNGSTITSGNGLADFYLARIANYQEYGRVVNGQLLGGAALGHWRQWDFEPYVQDDWKVTPRLTLNLGFRYFWLTPFYDTIKPTNDSVFVPRYYDPGKQAQLDVNGNIIPGTGTNYLTYGNGLMECGVAPIPKGCFKPYRGTVSPRFGFSWDPTGYGKWAIRGGYAMTWDSSNPLHTGAGFNGNPPVATNLYAYNLVGFHQIGTGPLPPSSFSDIPTDQKWPQIHVYSLGVQHELPGATVLAVNYVGTLAHHLGQNLNINQVPVGSGTVNVPALAGTTSCDAQGNCDAQHVLTNNLQPSLFFVPYRGYTTINQRDPSGNSNYNSLQISLRRSLAKDLTVQAAYTWSHTLDDIVNNSVDNSDVHRWYGTSYLNQSQMLILNYVYALPFLKNAHSPFVRGALSGWQISGVSSFLSGAPVDFTCGIDGMSSGIGGPVMCNGLGHFAVKKGTVNDPQFGPTPTWFDPSTIGQVTVDQLRADRQPGMFGTLGKHVLTGPGRNNWDLAIMKDFKLPLFVTDQSNLQFRLETFNSFNHPQWSGINLSCSGQTAPGAPCTGPNNIGNAEVSGAFPARIVQLALKLVF